MVLRWRSCATRAIVNRKWFSGDIAGILAPLAVYQSRLNSEK
jgi:hypothetical protein